MANLPSGTAYKRAHAVMIVVWAVMFPVALLTGLKKSLPFIVGISLYANLATEISSWQASRAEVKADEANITAGEATVHAEQVRTD